MSDNKASSSNFFVPFALIVLSVVTSILFSQFLNMQEEAPAAEASGSTGGPTETVSSAPGSTSIRESAQPAPDNNAAAVTESSEESVEDDQREKTTDEVEGIKLVADFSVLVPNKKQACDGQTPWREGVREWDEKSEDSPECYGLRFELSEAAKILLLKLRKGAAPRSLLAESCRPFGFNSTRFEAGQTQRLPRGVDGQAGVFQASPEAAETRFILVAATDAQLMNTDLVSLESGVANLCGQSATLTSEQVEQRLESLAKLAGIEIRSVTGRL